MLFNRRGRFRRGINDNNENSGEVIEFTQEEEPKVPISNDTPIEEINVNKK